METTLLTQFVEIDRLTLGNSPRLPEEPSSHSVDRRSTSPTVGLFPSKLMVDELLIFGYLSLDEILVGSEQSIRWEQRNGTLSDTNNCIKGGRVSTKFHLCSFSDRDLTFPHAGCRGKHSLRRTGRSRGWNFPRYVLFTLFLSG